jgi:hypothetical protein
VTTRRPRPRLLDRRLRARTVTVYRRPLAGVYDEVVTYADGESVHPLIDGAPAVSVSDLLG